MQECSPQITKSAAVMLVSEFTSPSPKQADEVGLLFAPGMERSIGNLIAPRRLNISLKLAKQ